ncbi:MAG: glutathione synthase [Gammaproteobacteria bacterium]|nr:glutathione synthase [Gammaproteobacteria bacterium]
MTTLALLMDPIAAIKPQKDSSLAMALAAQARGWTLQYLEMDDLYLRDGQAYARLRELAVRDDNDDWFSLSAPQDRPLAELDVVLMRKDPPIDTEYLYATQMLALAEHNDIIIKPLDAMGGASIFRVRVDDPNVGVSFETLTEHGSQYAMAQRYIPEISAGDKRILLVDGEPVPYALARVPAKGETRGNLAVGGTGVGIELSEHDRWICAQVAPRLKAMGLMFVGLDIIGDFLTEVNVTSPTCIRKLDALYGLDIGGQLMDAIERKLNA